jgi:hypothetical protein
MEMYPDKVVDQQLSLWTRQVFGTSLCISKDLCSDMSVLWGLMKREFDFLGRLPLVFSFLSREPDTKEKSRLVNLVVRVTQHANTTRFHHQIEVHVQRVT